MTYIVSGGALNSTHSYFTGSINSTENTADSHTLRNKKENLYMQLSNTQQVISISHNNNMSKTAFSLSKTINRN